MKYLNVDVLGAVIHRKRKSKKYTQAQFGSIAGISKETYLKREKDPGEITMNEFKKMAIALGEDPAELIRTATKEI